MGSFSKVVLVGPSYPFRGGIALFNDRLKKALDGHGVNATIVGFSRQYPDSFFPGKTQFIPGAAAEGEGTSERILDTINPITWLQAGKRICRLCPDVVLFSWWHIWFLPCFLFLSLYLRIKKVKTIFLCHNFRSHGGSVLEEAMVHQLLSKIGGIVFLSRQVGAKWKKRYPPAVTLFHPVYDFTHLIKVKIRDQWCRRMLFAGYGKSYKGLDIALALLNMDDNLRLTVAGEFYEPALLQRLKLADTEYGDRLEVIAEYVSDERLISLMDEHDMLLCPYTEATQSGMAAFAMGRERAVAATPAGGLPEQILPGGGVVSKEISPPSFYAAVQQIYRRTPLEWHRDIQQRKAQLSWEVFVSQLCSTHGLVREVPTCNQIILSEKRNNGQRDYQNA